MKTKGGYPMRDLWRSPLSGHFLNDIELFGLAAGLRPVAKKEGRDEIGRAHV